MIIRCNVCNADPTGRWKSPPGDDLLRPLPGGR
jgi:hypothetical protein